MRSSKTGAATSTVCAPTGLPRPSRDPSAAGRGVRGLTPGSESPAPGQDSSRFGATVKVMKGPARPVLTRRRGVFSCCRNNPKWAPTNVHETKRFFIHINFRYSAQASERFKENVLNCEEKHLKHLAEWQRGIRKGRKYTPSLNYLSCTRLLILTI